MHLQEGLVTYFNFVCCRELESDSKLAQILQDQDLQKANLVIKLMEDSDLQKAAVGTLLERGDARSWGLLQQVRLVESQLVTLTNIEIDRKKLKMDEHLVCKDFFKKSIFKFNIEFDSINRKCSYQVLLFMELDYKKCLVYETFTGLRPNNITRKYINFFDTAL